MPDRIAVARFPSVIPASRLSLRFTVAGLVLAAVFSASPQAQAADAFTIAVPPGMVAEPISNRRFDIGYGLKSPDGSLPVPGTSSYPCMAGFKFVEANNGMSRAEINRVATSKEWRQTARAIIGTLFTVSAERRITVQGYHGLELDVSPRIGPGAENVRGLMSVVETPKGRMTVVCLTTHAAFAKARPLFRAVPKGARLPE